MTKAGLAEFLCTGTLTSPEKNSLRGRRALPPNSRQSQLGGSGLVNLFQTLVLGLREKAVGMAPFRGRGKKEKKRQVRESCYQVFVC